LLNHFLLQCRDHYWRIAVEKHVLDAGREFVKRSFEIEAVRVGAKFEGALEDRRGGARAEAAIEQRAAPIIDDFGGVKSYFEPRPLQAGQRRRAN